MKEEIQEPYCVAMRGRNADNPSDRTAGIPTEQRLEPKYDGTTNTITSVQKDNLIVEPKILGYTRDRKGHVQNYHENDYANTIHGKTGWNGNTSQFVVEPKDNPLNPYEDGTARTINSQYYKNGKANFTRNDGLAATGACNNNGMYPRIRKLTERECFRLMGVHDDDIDKIQAYRDEKGKPISKSQQYKMAGNSIVTNVLMELFRKLLIDKECESQQLLMF